MESAISINLNAVDRKRYMHGSCEYSAVFVNRPFEEISSVNLSPLMVQQIRLLIVLKDALPETIMFHLKLMNGEDMVLRYQNLSDDFKASKVKEVLGGYKIKPYCMTLNKALLDFTTHSKMDMQSVGLHLSMAQKNTLVRKIIQDYWFFDRNYNLLYNNEVTGLAQALNCVLSGKLPLSLSQFHLNTYLAFLTKNKILSESDIIEFKNIESSACEEDQVKVEYSKLEKQLEQQLLAKCSQLDIPFHLGFSRTELIEVIRDQYELCRASSIGGFVNFNLDNGLDLSSYIKARIWLGSVVGSDEKLMNLQTKLEDLKAQL